jgi:hypothetical protein
LTVINEIVLKVLNMIAIIVGSCYRNEYEKEHMFTEYVLLYISQLCWALYSVSAVTSHDHQETTILTAILLLMRLKIREVKEFS